MKTRTDNIKYYYQNVNIGADRQPIILGEEVLSFLKRSGFNSIAEDGIAKGCHLCRNYDGETCIVTKSFDWTYFKFDSHDLEIMLILRFGTPYRDRNFYISQNPRPRGYVYFCEDSSKIKRQNKFDDFSDDWLFSPIILFLNILNLFHYLLYHLVY